MVRFRLFRGAIVGAWLAGAATVVAAQVSTEESASVIVFPKVIADGSWDTTIQIANGANRPTQAVCYYVNAQRIFPQLPPGPGNEPQWIVNDFGFALSRHQPTHWVASRGRVIGAPTVCTSASPDCDTAGAFSGRVPPLPEDFTGELVCIETDASGAPWSGNSLRGQATLTHLGTGEVVKYPAVGLAGFPSNDADGRLCLGGRGQSDDCPPGGEYAACPRAWVVSHPSSYDDSQVDRGVSRTRLTVVPCSQNLDAGRSGQVVLSIRVINELELSFSTSTTVECWADIDLGELSEIFERDVNGGDWLQTDLRVAPPDGGGFLLVQQTEQERPRVRRFYAVATTPHQKGSASGGDTIVLPAEGVR
jgi:hypothetical protein